MKSNVSSKLFYKTFVDRVFLLCFLFYFYIGLINSISWSEESVFQFSKEYWEKKGKNTTLVLEGKEWERSLDKKSGILSFVHKSNIDLGEYRFIRAYLISECGSELRWGWESQRLANKVSQDRMGLINDGKLHNYTFILRFPDGNNSLFDITGKIYLQINGVEEGKKIDLVKIEFLPYEDARPRQITIGSVCMDVLWNKDVSFTKKIEEESYLEFYTGIYNAALGSYCKSSKKENWETDGVEFLIDIIYGGNKETLYQSEMKPKSNEDDKNWRRVELDLSKYANLEVTFTFKMGALGNEIGDFGVWGNPMVVTKSKQAGNYTPIFIISCDTLRPDHLLPYGYDLPTSPHLDKFARDAVVFENAYTTQTFTPVAHMSMLTGKYPTSHGLTKNTDVYSHVNVISEVLRNYGYQTAGFTGFLWWFMPSRGFSRGMDLFSVPESIEEDNKRKDRRSVFEVCEEAKQWIEGVGDDRIFAFLHNYDVHSKAYGDLIYDADEEKFKVFSRGLKKPEIWHEGCEDVPAGVLFLEHVSYGDVLPSEEEIEYNRALYDDCVYKVDQALGDFFDFLKNRLLYDKSMIVIVSDHGESLGEHGWYGHENVYEESAKVVSIIKFPLNRFAGLRVKERTILEDIVPTILEVLDKGNELDVDGCSVLKVLADMEKREREEKQIDEREVFTSNSGINMKALIKGNYKLLEDIRRGDKKLFDLSRQMPEYYDISTERPEIFRELSEGLFQRFALEKQGWWLCFLNTSSFQAGRVDITCSVPVVSSKIQGGVWRTINDRLSPTELRGSYFLPKSPTPAVLQIIPTDDANELKVSFQGNPSLKYPQEYRVEQTKMGKHFYFVSNEFMGKERRPSESDGHFYFWVEYYPRGQEEDRKTVNLPDDAQETLRNLGYLN